MLASPTDRSGYVPRRLLWVAGWLWASYLLSWLPAPSGSDLLRGVLDGLFVLPLILGTCIAGAALWAGLRVRRSEVYWAAAASLPLAALCWWQAFSGRLPGRP